jgi:hypothetical protein
MQGAVKTLLLRGQVIVRDGQYVGNLDQGQFIKRKPYAEAYAEERPVVGLELEEVAKYTTAGDRETPVLEKAGFQAEP